MLEKVQAAIHQGGLACAGDRIGVAVSGGADSVALLFALKEMGCYSLTVLHANHGLRGTESDGDQEFVCSLAWQLDLPVQTKRLTLGAGNLEQEARNARYGWFQELMETGAVDRVAVGHTRSDQAETVLFRFLRGAGTSGLAAILPVTKEGIFRPLLSLSRSEILTFLREKGISWREDSSNQDGRFARNRIRHQLLPQLKQEWNPAIEKSLSQTAEWAQARGRILGRRSCAFGAELRQGRSRNFPAR